MDLIEVRSVDALINAGVHWKTLREAHQHAQEFIGHTHPFCTNRFATDGTAVFMEFKHQNVGLALWDIGKVQRVFDKIIQPFLKNIEFNADEIATRWWPLGKDHLVALDPRRKFGQPIIFEEGVPTDILARSVRANKSVEQVAKWFEITLQSVREAVQYEQQLVA